MIENINLRKRQDLTGKQFGRLTVIEASQNKTAARGMIWLCKCDCGTIKEIAARSLITGMTVSCGCYNKEVILAKNTKHGYHGTPTYKSWDKMIQRCSNPKSEGYELYGGRGITVCDEWKDFANFISDMGERPSNLHSIDRIDTNGNYKKENCRWATSFIQANNTRRNTKIEYNGHVYTIAELARIYNVKYDTLYCRIMVFKWNIDNALNISVSHSNCKKRY